MRRLLILAVLFSFTGCTAPERPSWFPDTGFYTKNQQEFFDKSNEQDLK